MRVKKIKFKDEDALIIYLSKNESQDEVIMKTIENYKEQFKDVAIFVSGSKNMEEVITRIIKARLL